MSKQNLNADIATQILTKGAQTAEDARYATDFVRLIELEVIGALQEVNLAIAHQKYEATYMHSRCMTTKNGINYVAGALGKRGFIVTTGEGIDCKANNFERIKISWQ